MYVSMRCRTKTQLVQGMSNNPLFKTVAAAALARFDVVMDWLGLAGGKNSGSEYLPLNPKRDDHTAGSLSIHRTKGAWMEGATGDKGGDLVSLAAYLWDCGNGEAAERLGRQLGVDVPERQKRTRSNANGAGNVSMPATPEKRASEPRKLADSGADGVCVMPVPVDAPPAPALHPRHGKPSARWVYVDQAGAVNFHHCRFEPEGERKQFAPLSLWKMPNGRFVWKWKAPTDPRPPMRQQLFQRFHPPQKLHPPPRLGKPRPQQPRVSKNQIGRAHV